ncbi:MAG: 23S rRNA (adenine(2503)-C(2))-methyltransferase RlmN [Spirochaetia bacterium]|nr:23S rRNA (adenine(2503)-C(2))-methyltransferase RlmN [Spirochaetia bacterium]
MSPKRSIRDIGPAGLLPEELALRLALSPSFRGKQVFSWISHGVASYADMSNLSADDRERLSTQRLYTSSVAESIEGDDGSVKLKIRLEDGAAIESVLLVDVEDRMTACLSTQVGCPMGCAFCKTGTLGFLRNLGADEIVEQFLHLSAIRGRPSNIVFMGMGEPLDNIDALRKSIVIFTHPDGMAISRRKITISTCGVVPGIRDLADKGPHVRLALSLTAARDELRSALMPVNKTWNLAQLKSALAYYQEKTGDRITLEAAIMGGENSDRASAEAMASWIGSLKVQVNLIPWNPVPGLPYREPAPGEVAAFEAELERRGINTVRRARRGRGVSGACGQLGDTLSADSASED